MILQIEITLKPKSRGFHLVTSEIMSQLPKLPKTGIINIFCKHTSCGLSINENADPDVRVDMETIGSYALVEITLLLLVILCLNQFFYNLFVIVFYGTNARRL